MAQGKALSHNYFTSFSTSIKHLCVTHLYDIPLFNFNYTILK